MEVREFSNPNIVATQKETTQIPGYLNLYTRLLRRIACTSSMRYCLSAKPRSLHWRRFCLTPTPGNSLSSSSSLLSVCKIVEKLWIMWLIVTVRVFQRDVILDEIQIVQKAKVVEDGASIDYGPRFFWQIVKSPVPEATTPSCLQHTIAPLYDVAVLGMFFGKIILGSTSFCLRYRSY